MEHSVERRSTSCREAASWEGNRGSITCLSEVEEEEKEPEKDRKGKDEGGGRGGGVGGE